MSYQRIGGLIRASRYDGKALTQAPRDAFLASFERQADPDGVLEPAERSRRAKLLLRAHMNRLALASAKARKRKKAATGSTVDLTEPDTGSNATEPGGEAA